MGSGLHELAATRGCIAVLLALAPARRSSVQDTRLIDADEPVAGPREGLLVLDVDSVYEVHGLKFGARKVEHVGKGRNLIILVVGAGSCSSATSTSAGCAIGFKDPSLRFEVHAGQLNYPAADHRPPQVARCPAVQPLAPLRQPQRGRLELLEERYPALLDAHPIEYTGFMRDDFLAVFREARLANAGEGEEGEAPIGAASEGAE